MFLKVLLNYRGSDYISNITAFLRNVKGCNEVFIYSAYKENLSFILALVWYNVEIASPTNSGVWAIALERCRNPTYAI